ncbi:sensor histidine kinase [Roseateles oligotrophus]|uniref:histidine kinase n=1 Tax=Roseateles oligotrophus TaxID=1769250 RepID=A0ABT2Y941_9BURK|nr:sensor histidine kinase [Roseateles oligotrophus]MCV2366821.1 sensor histidine kinase [Roseateles oligotrophus]
MSGSAMGASSLRRQLMVGILLPVVLLIAFNTVGLYRQALLAADTAYDRTLLATAKSIGELLEVSSNEPGVPKLHAKLSYSALEAFEADNRSRLYYRVSGFADELVSGFDDLPAWKGEMPTQGPYAALVTFYDDSFRGEAVRMAVLLQPVAGAAGQGMATIQVAETLELRRTLARQILVETVWRQVLLVLVIGLVVVVVVQRVTAPVRRLSQQLRDRSEGDLSPVQAPDAPREWLPLVEATNQVVERLRQLLEYQKRFIRDASHQLKTPLAVLKVQVQSALHGDVEPMQALAEIDQTVSRATQVANQMLALAKVEQLRQGLEPLPTQDWAALTRVVALDLAPLIAEQHLDFDIETESAGVDSHAWALRELTRNLLHNALLHTPAGGRLSIKLERLPGHARLTIADSGPGLSPEQQSQLFLPFAAGHSGKGSGLGLAICQGIAQSLGGSIALQNRVRHGQIEGLDAVAELPLSGSMPS